VSHPLGRHGENWGSRYPAIVRRRDNVWDEFGVFLDYDLEIRHALQHEGDREPQRPLPAGDQSPRPLSSEQAALK
jgi:hypothetical protein